MASADRTNSSYVCRVLRPTLLAPDIVEAILDGRQQSEMTLAVVMKPFPSGVGGAAAKPLRVMLRCCARSWPSSIESTAAGAIGTKKMRQRLPSLSLEPARSSGHWEWRRRKRRN